MAIDRSGPWWVGSEREDLAAYLRHHKAGGYRVGMVVPAPVCAVCGADDGYGVRLDDEAGFAERVCAACGAAHPMLDSQDQAEDADPGEAACPCGHETFQVAVGFSRRRDRSVRWVSVGLRCLECGVLGCYVDWKIDYEPSAHLLEAV